MPEDLLDDDTMAASRRGAIEAPAALCLVIMSSDYTGSVALPERGTVTLGRGADCEVRLDDPRLSRRHAQFRCDDGVSVVDLGSRNGTLLRDENLPANVPVALRVGDSIALGGTVVVLQRAVAGFERPRHVWSHGYFEARLEEECSAATPDTPFAVVRLRLDPALGLPTDSRGPVAPQPLVGWLQPSDMVAVYAPNEFEVLVTRKSAVDVEARAAQLSRELRRAGIVFAIAVATYPRDGRTPEALIEHTTRLLRREVAAPGEHSEPALVRLGAIERMDRIVVRVAAGAINVLVLGETGVGKEILSRRIHDLSARASKALVSLNCAALSESLLESELFGHEKGAFTGALQAKPGLLESADGGTVFLDEIGEMPLSVQAKLLRVVEHREVTRVGALRPRAIDVRFVSATHRDLEAEIARGRFRQDLYFRLNGITLTLPPLRERVDEIEPLARLFVEHACRAMKRTAVPRIADDALETLRSYQWPGNIRELRNVIERAVLLSSGDVISREHLPIEKLGAILAPSVRMAARPAIPVDEPAQQPETVTQEIQVPEAFEVERLQIVQALEKCGGNQSQAARMLRMSRQTFIRRLEDYAIPRPRKHD